jgi:hypothetical protein
VRSRPVPPPSNTESQLREANSDRIASAYLSSEQQIDHEQPPPIKARGSPGTAGLAEKRGPKGGGGGGLY